MNLDTDCTDFHRLPAVATGTEARVCADIAARQAVGLKKYGTTVEANPLLLREWLQHAYEETLDQSVYLKRSMEELAKLSPLLPRDQVLKAIADEPEYPGECPPMLMGFIRQAIQDKDESAILHMMRQSVRLTKQCITERVNGLPEHRF